MDGYYELVFHVGYAGFENEKPIGFIIYQSVHLLCAESTLTGRQLRPTNDMYRCICAVPSTRVLCCH